MNRRAFLQSIAGAAIAPAAGGGYQQAAGTAKPDFTLRIAPLEMEIAPRRKVKTIAYNGSVPGPVLRLREGQPVTIEVFNESDVDELVHWHGLWIPPDVDGAMEEGTPMVEPHGSRRYQFVARPAGTRWYHSHTHAGRDLRRSTYTGQFGSLIIEAKDEPGRYDQEVLLALHGWEPFLGHMEGDAESPLDVKYRSFTVNGHTLGAGEPVRVKEGQRILFRIVNASATMFHRLALPGHLFEVVALDGNPAPAPRKVAVLEMGPGERIDAVVEMSRPGAWILGATDERTRKAGLGTVIEYAGRSGAPQWQPAPNDVWDYTIFGRSGPVAEPDARVPLIFGPKEVGGHGIDHWTINGKEYPKTDRIRVRKNRKYRLILNNQSSETHPIHLHRHTFELVKVAGKATGGIRKDVVAVPSRREVEIQFTADNAGLSLFHCHMQLHMDFGFMTQVQYED